MQFAKARPGQTSFGSPGNGTPPHLAGELLKNMTEIDPQHVPDEPLTALSASHHRG
jgi:tripartite-type tricarboxylate transporter receptor subunit TctC